jgi:hypothetical protein
MKNMQNTMIPLTVANTLDQTTKQRIEAKPNQTLKQAVQAKNLAPQGAFDVYDQLGKVISGNNVANHRDATVYVGVAKVAGGAFKSASLAKLKQSEYPSMRHVNQHSTRSSVGAFVVNLPGVYSHDDRSQVMYTLLVDARDFPNLPTAYVLTPVCADIAHPNIYMGNSFSVAPGRSLCAVCVGNMFGRTEWPENWQNAKISEDIKMGVFLDQVRMVLNNPNPDDPARVV